MVCTVVKVKGANICIISMDDNAVNVITPSYLTSLHLALDYIETVYPLCSIILQGNYRTFSAGLDLGMLQNVFKTFSPELLKKIGKSHPFLQIKLSKLPYNQLLSTYIPTITDLSEIELFIPLLSYLNTVVSLGRRLASYPRPTAALVTGHAIAGGTFFISCCDFRFSLSTPVLYQYKIKQLELQYTAQANIGTINSLANTTYIDNNNNNNTNINSDSNSNTPLGTTTTTTTTNIVGSTTGSNQDKNMTVVSSSSMTPRERALSAIPQREGHIMFGLNEVKNGFLIPPSFFRIISQAIHNNTTSFRSLTLLGQLYDVNVSRNIGLLHELYPKYSNMLQYTLQLINIPIKSLASYACSKKMLQLSYMSNEFNETQTSVSSDIYNVSSSFMSSFNDNTINNTNNTISINKSHHNNINKESYHKQNNHNDNNTTDIINNHHKNNIAYEDLIHLSMYYGLDINATLSILQHKSNELDVILHNKYIELSTYIKDGTMNTLSAKYMNMISSSSRQALGLAYSQSGTATGTPGSPKTSLPQQNTSIDDNNTPSSSSVTSSASSSSSQSSNGTSQTSVTKEDNIIANTRLSTLPLLILPEMSIQDIISYEKMKENIFIMTSLQKEYKANAKKQLEKQQQQQQQTLNTVKAKL